MSDPKFNPGDRVKVIGNVDSNMFVDIYRGETGPIHRVGYEDPDYGQAYSVYLSEVKVLLTFFESELEKVT